MDFKFEYFLNAIHYNIYLEEVWSNKKTNKMVNGLFAVIFKIPFIGKYRKKYDGQKTKELYDFYYGKKVGLSISVAHHLFDYFYSCHPAFLSFVLLGIPDGMFGGVNLIVAMAVIALPIGLCYIPAYRAVFSKDRYLKYFKQFEKEDEQWHKKWKRITWVFCIGSVIFAIGGIFAMWGVSLLFRE